MPFALLGFDTDNDSVFMNETVKTYCDEAGLVFTRCRPYRKNDQAWVEQKNGAVVRQTVGYRRYEGLEAAAALARLYAALRLFVNFFQPSFKLARKTRDGAKVKKTYHPPATPYQRLLADTRTGEAVRRRVNATFATLDPVQLLQTIRLAQQELVDIANRPPGTELAASATPRLELFLSGLRTAWRDGEVRPTLQSKPKAPRGRRRPDPFLTVTPRVREWFEAEPWRTSRELFERLQKDQPEVFPDGQLRTLQRRLKGWRRDLAHKMVFGGAEVGGKTLSRFGLLLRLERTVPRCSLRGRSGARHPRHARAKGRAARGCGWLRSSHPLRCAPRRQWCQVGMGKQVRRSNRKAGFA